ncbi:MAG TPA: hypothetical protein VNZ57_02685, partial [Longimicrobiales bacterium]|nr:hypothetical protein [Longimicrobiales bacterium]
LHEALSERFALRYFRFDAGAERIEEVTPLTFGGTRTYLGGALRRVHDELSSVPLAGLVVVSDGADNEGVALSESLLALQASGVPVFTIGVGRERFERDVELVRIETPRTVLRGSSVVVDLLVSHQGYAGRTIPIYVEDEARIVTMQEVTLPNTTEPVPVRVTFTAETPGVRRFRFRIPTQDGEQVLENNQREALISVENRREKILYFEGEPRWEVKFIRRAIHDDENLQVVVLQRTADRKFMRLDVDSGDELAGGFPATREELFQYRALILGSVEASFFTQEQLRMIADFVSVRGGGLLMLGGRNAFSEGGFYGTPLEELVPFMLRPAPQEAGAQYYLAEVEVRPTRAGLTHPITQLDTTEAASQERWNSLPPLTMINRAQQLAPGATELLSGVGRDGDRHVVLAHQRYGRGNVLAFPVQDSWIWQMHADIPVDDMTHEIFWRQMLRWLVHNVPDRVTITLPRERVEAGDAVLIMAQVEDEAYRGVNDASVIAYVTSPIGEEIMVPMEWTVGRDGEYRGSFTPEMDGPYTVEVEAVVPPRPGSTQVTMAGAASADEGVGRTRVTSTRYLDVGPSPAEYFGASMNAALLRRVAEETGGRFYTPETAATLPEDITYTGAGVTLVEENELWDMPILFLLLVGLLGGEWIYRRRRSLA